MENMCCARPDRRGYFGPFGGRFVPETLISSLEDLEKAYLRIKKDPSFHRELRVYLREFAGRPTPLYLARNLSQAVGRGLKVYLKREDLLHTGAHKINNTLAQVLLAKRMGKSRVIAETGAGQHGVATATACALMGLECVVYMGKEDIERQSLNVYRMRLLGARVCSVTSGSCTLKDAINEAMRDWVTNVRTTFYCLGSVVGPHPYPMMVRDFQSIIGREVKSQMRKREARLPDYLIACVGGGSNAMGLFHPFFSHRLVKCIGVEAAGSGLTSHRLAATLLKGSTGILHGSKSKLLQDRFGQVLPAHSVAPGLDYPGVGPEHTFYQSIGRAQYVAVDDRGALEGFRLLSSLEGIIPALEPSHAIYYFWKTAPRLPRASRVVICLSGRGDKDIDIARRHLL